MHVASHRGDARRRVAAFRRYLEAFNRGDIEAMLAETEPTVEFRTPRGAMIRGHGALRAAMEEPSNLELTIEPQRWFANGSTFAIVHYCWAETGEPAGAEDQAAVAIAGVGGLRSIRPYLDRDAALADAGMTLAHEVLEPGT